MSKLASKTPKKPIEYITERITIEKLIPGGQALATLSSGQKIFLWNALPGEIATKTQLTKRKSTYLEGIVLDFEHPSPYREVPRDLCYLSTSPWQILNYQFELEQKSLLLQEIFRQHGIAIPIIPVVTDDHDFGYRNKMEYSLFFDHDDQLIHLAFRARGSHRKIPVATSSLERPEILAKAQQTVDELNHVHTDARQFQSLLLRANQSGEISGGLYENHHPHPQFTQLHDQILGYEYSYSPNGFFQINLPVYELALRDMRPWVKTPAVLDLYAGVGTIGLSIAREHELTLVECDKSAYRELEHNCEGTTAHPVWSKSETALDYLQNGQTVILDPPRAGCHTALLEKLLTTSIATVIYLSCNPATQARDIKILSERYRIMEIQPFNFFPRTPHLENLVVLQRSA